MEESKSTNRSIKLLSSDGYMLNIDMKTACLSGFVRGMVETDPDFGLYEIHNVKYHILEIVIRFLNLLSRNASMREIEKPINSSIMSENVDSWAAEFIDEEYNSKYIYDIILAANYMDIDSLRNLACAKVVASSILNKTTEQMRVKLDIIDDTTDEQKILFKEEESWCNND